MGSSAREPLQAITAQYDRVARFYALMEPLFLIFPPARRKAVAALDLSPGAVVLEVGAGTGRNLPYLVDAVGPAGAVIAVDASKGMLAEAQKLVGRRKWSNVQLLREDAAKLRVDRELDGVLFSLSYSVLPEPAAALEHAWEKMRPGARVVVMDVGLTDTRFRQVLAPIARLLTKLGPGDPYSRPWDDLRRYGSVGTERFLFGLYYVCVVVKSESGA